MVVCIVVCMIVGYLFGCIQTGYIVGRVNKIDIRDYGSGNSGTTNTLRTLGKTAAIITFLGDAAKGLVAVNLARYVIMPAFGVEGQAYLWLLTGFAVVLGHNFPFYMKFKGGKGIAVSFGVLLAFFPIWKPVLLLAFFYILFSVVFKIRSHRRRSIVTFGCFCVGCLSLVPIPAILLGCVLISCIVIYKHHLMEEKSNESANLIL